MTQTEMRDPDAIERDIRRTQEEMSDTVDRIGDQMTPRRLFESLLDKADENGIDARYVLNGARRNPLALGLISAGAIWLVSDYDAKPGAFTSQGGGSGTGDSYRHDPDHRSYIEHMSQIGRDRDEDDVAYARRRDEHRGNYLMIERDHDEDHSSYRQRLDDATSSLREKRDSFADSVRQGSHDATRQGKRIARKGREAYYDNPLVGGLAAAIVGAVAGSIIPASQAEREKLGPSGAKALHKAEDKLHDVGDKAQQKKDELVAKADRKIEEQGPA